MIATLHYILLTQPENIVPSPIQDYTVIFQNGNHRNYG